MYHLLQVSSPTPRSHARTLVSVMLLALLFPPAPAVALMPLVPRDSCRFFIAAVVTRPPPGTEAPSVHGHSSVPTHPFQHVLNSRSARTSNR